MSQYSNPFCTIKDLLYYPFLSLLYKAILPVQQPVRVLAVFCGLFSDSPFSGQITYS